LLLEEQFPSNYYVWRRLAYEKGATVRTVPFPTDGDWTNRVLEFITSEVAVAALPHVHWTNGGQLDLRRIAKVLRSNGGALILDLTQSLGVLPFSVCDVQPDFAVAACYKWLLGPYSVAILYVAPNWHSGQPLEENWIQRANAHDFASLMVYTEEYEQGARRFDMGERSNFALLPAATAGVEQLLKWDVTEISDSLSVLTRLLCSSAADIGFASLPENLRAPHYACLSRKEGMRKHLLEALTDRKIFVSIRGNSLRVTPHIYNSADDIHILCSCLQRIVNSRTETPS
jgi:selenocysteine lyase/cysteine desulfurase